MAELCRRIEEFTEGLVGTMQEILLSGDETGVYDKLEVAYTALAREGVFDERRMCYRADDDAHDADYKVRFPSRRSNVEPLAQLLVTLQVLHQTLSRGGSITKRDLYYADPVLFGSQAASDHMLCVVQGIFQVQRWELGVYAAMRGLAQGPLEVHVVRPQPELPRRAPATVAAPAEPSTLPAALAEQMSARDMSTWALLAHQRQGAEQAAGPADRPVMMGPAREDTRSGVSLVVGREIPTDAAPSGQLWRAGAAAPLPSQVRGSGVTLVRGHVDFVLVVEKETVYHKLAALPATATLPAQSFAARYNCLVVTGRGYPGLATRNFIRAVQRALPAAPVFALVDGDPHGVDIYCKYAFGTPTQARDCPFGIAGLQHIGLRISDIHAELGLPAPAAEPKGTVQLPAPDIPQPERDVDDFGAGDNARGGGSSKVKHTVSGGALLATHGVADAARLASQVLRPLTATDRSKLNTLLYQPFFTQSARDAHPHAEAAYRELCAMARLGVKAEIEALTVLSDTLLEDYCVRSIRKTIPGLYAR